MTTYQIDQGMQRLGFHPIDACCLTNDGSYQSITCFERDLSHTEYVNEGFYNPAQSFVEIQQEVLPTLASADISGTMSYGYEDMWNGGHEMGKRLNQMVPIPHVPKVNGEIPSDDEVTSDHQRLLNRLELYDLEELKVSGDGNCQFRSLSDQIYRTPDHHKLVREEVVSQLKSEPQLYQNYVPMAYDGYLRKMSKSGEWGDHVTLQAAADFYGVKIFVITSFKDTCYLEILPQIEKSKRTIFLSFWAEVHYNSIYPVGEAPKDEKKKSRWWQST